MRQYKNACAGIPYRAAGCFLKVRKAKLSVTVSLLRRLLGNAALQKCVCRYSVPCSRLLSESTKSQNERDSFLAVQVVWKCENIEYLCWSSVPCSRRLSESTKSQNERDNFLRNATIQNACAGIPYHAAGCFLKVRKAKLGVTVSLPCRLVANATI